MKILKDNMILKSALYILATIILVGAGFFVYKKVTAVNTYKEITFSELQKLVDSGDKFILFIGSNSCSHCTTFKETLNTNVIPVYHVVVNYIDISELSDAELGYINARFYFSATPTTVFIGEGEEEVSERVLKKAVGALSSKDFIELLKKYEFVE